MMSADHQSSVTGFPFIYLLAIKSTTPIRTRPNITWLNNAGMLSIPDSKDLLASNPATPAAREEDKNQSPIICPLYFFGEYFAVAASPTGLRHSSPKVWNR